MNAQEIALLVVERMYESDSFSQWLGIERLSVSPGKCVLSMKIADEMVNGFGLAHGAITFALADSALAFASNSHGKKCLSIDTQISHLKPCRIGDEIRAEATEISRSKTLGRYNVEVRNQDEVLVAHFRGTVFIKSESWLEN